MAYQIVWSQNAIEDYQRIISYLLEHWSLNTASEFVEHVEKRLAVLSVHPFIGIASEKIPKIRSILLSQHNRMYYQVSEDQIQILAIFDLRQNPDKNPY